MQQYQHLHSSTQEVLATKFHTKLVRGSHSVVNARTKVKEAEIARMLKTLDELEAHYSPAKHHQTDGGSTKATFHCKGCRGLQLEGDANAAPVQCDGSQGPQPEGGPTTAHGNGDFFYKIIFISRRPQESISPSLGPSF